MSDTNDVGDVERPGKGHNLPPIETPDEIAERLALTYLALIGRRDALLGMKDRLPAPDKIDADTEKKLSDAIKAAQTFIKSSEARRADEKEPFLAAERAVDGFFYQCSDPIEKLKDTMTELLSGYQRAKARKEAERRAAEARAAEEARLNALAEQRKAEAAERKRAAEFEAAAKAADAKRASDAARSAAASRAAASREASRRADEAREAAAAAADRAEATRRATRVTRAELSRSRSDLGVVASLRTVWDHEITDPGRVPRSYCSPDKALIATAIKVHTTADGKCPLKIAGVKIFPASNTVTR